MNALTAGSTIRPIEGIRAVDPRCSQRAEAFLLLNGTSCGVTRW